MKELNFRTLEHLSVPDELMESLLSIPETAGKKPAVTPRWRNRTALAAASLVFVSVLSLLILMLFHGFDSVLADPSDSRAVQPRTNATRNSVSTEEMVGSVVTGSEETATVTEYAAVTDERHPAFTDLPTESKLGSTEVGQLHPNSAEPGEYSTPASVTTNPGIAEPTDSSVSQNPTQHVTPPGYLSVSFSVEIDASLITDGEMVYGWVKELDDDNREVKTYISDYQIHYRFLNDETALITYDAEIEPVQGTKTYAYLFYNERGEVLASGTKVIDFSP